MNNQAMSPEQALAQAQARIAELEARIAQKSKVTVKIAPKGGVSVYGLGRFPVTLYASQWEQLLGHGEVIKQFISNNAQALASKEG